MLYVARLARHFAENPSIVVRSRYTGLHNRVLASVSAQLLRTAPVPGIERWLATDVPHPTRPEGLQAPGWTGLDPPGFSRAVDFAWHQDANTRESIMWTRLRLPLVAGETPSPLVRLAATSDFASGSSSDAGGSSACGRAAASLAFRTARSGTPSGADHPSGAASGGSPSGAGRPSDP